MIYRNYLNTFTLRGSMSDDNLVVVSKVKAWVKDRSGLSTSAAVMPELSKILQKELVKAIKKAQDAGRKTVLDRDIEHTQE